jgi:hypothetical protein
LRSTLRAFSFAALPKNVIGLHELTQAELVGDELPGLELAGQDRLEQPS